MGPHRSPISPNRPTAMVLGGYDILDARQVLAGQPIPYRLIRRAKRLASQELSNSGHRSSKMRSVTGDVGTVSSHLISWQQTARMLTFSVQRPSSTSTSTSLSRQWYWI